MVTGNLGFFIYVFSSIFVVVSPISGVVTFISLTSKMTRKEKNEIAKKAVVLACVIALFFAITGSVILKLFSISVDSLRVAGGLLLFSIAFDMMHAKVSRESITEEEITQSQEREDIWVFPIGLPLLTGPGTISTVIVLMGVADGVQQKAIVLISIIFAFIICLIVFLFSRRLHKFIGYNGMLVFTRLMGLLLAALAVDLTATGIINIFGPVI
ncbi:MarC family transcriptional regulator [Methanosarcina sp. 2.H.T.1A.6]|uniref:MarC family protein n=1 Tax=unclassified Methanosarcina TaxID=2644672 RepID=UPI000622471A|nr:MULTISPECIES: MarC family protein [unclassified Methanosarcina]KKG10913.1 MarC family transcriptional regulator [Methanosarcina sp. 2.H.T.1A.15]KKG17835.1 MarC family transcriptional regulator [Methanosarcina sp. 2.H.T.1A.3]KKG19432.1 MarC family transcriptional regulator [Methanosarcina sp. 2.H.T.1A.6]KKG27482.1 MarC family transcriptional regulator [Methanosarcina sp. 2.H.T.1A.8]KKH47132.1 MarC family transcriptional regulator [Methanosarcina sp. 1.H.A.2.2]